MHNGSGISPRVEVNSHIVGSYNTLFATRIFNTSDPRSKIAINFGANHLDQGSVLV